MLLTGAAAAAAAAAKGRGLGYSWPTNRSSPQQRQLTPPCR
jgi:hypothetical protein